MQFKIFNFKSVTSTNDIAIQLIRKKKNRYGFIFSKNQSKGRGTHGKKWVSESGNLYVSIFFPLRKIYPPYSEFSIINPVIIYNIIKKFCKKNTITFKNPNDILLNKK
jgi:BirA family biotin operon repressor/biotin-[acetyl-CoA-carboxylase] ligase